MDAQRRSELVAELSSVLLEDAPDGEALVGRIQRAVLCPRQEAQAIVFEAAAEVNANLFPPMRQVELVLTEGCNLGCTYCFEKDMLGYRSMHVDIARRAIDLLIRYSQDERDLHIAHFGGEPTLRFDTVRLITEYARNRAASTGKRVDFNMTTNGVLIDEEIASHCADQGIRVLLSIDGLETAHDRYRKDKRGRGTFTKAMNGMKILKRFQPWIGIKMTVMPDNVEYLHEDVLSLHDMGVNQFVIGHATGVDWCEDRMLAYVRAMARLNDWYVRAKGDDLVIQEFDEPNPSVAYFGCQAGRSSMSVSVDGQVSPCSKILALNNKKLLGKLGDVWCGLTHIKNRIDLVGCSKLKAACGKRGIGGEYQGGCFVSNYNENHDLFVPSATEHKLSVLQRSMCSGCGGSKQTPTSA